MAASATTLPDVLSAVRKAAGTVLLRRALEWATVTAAAAAFGAAAMELAAVAGTSRVLALLVCFAAVAAGVALAVAPALRRAVSLEGALAVLAGVACGLPAVVWAACLLVGWQSRPPPALLAGAAVACGALLGGIARIVMGVSLREAAILWDLQGCLDERLSTAIELASSPLRHEPFAEAVYSQALAATRQKPLRDLAPWRRTAATAAALGLGVALCATLALLPTGEPRTPLSPVLRTLADSLERATARQQRRLIVAFRAAGQEAEEGELAVGLAAAAAAIEATDAARLKRALRQIEKQLRQVGPRQRERLLQELLAAAAIGDSVGEDAVAGADGGGAGDARAGSPAASGDDGAVVAVYDPLYAELLRVKTAGDVVDERPRAAARPETVPLEQAWLLARDRAETALMQGRVPGEYRRLVRDFFSVQSTNEMAE